ncbi:MAG TPA: hypothetical protein VFV70_00045 [Hyphomonadaceae bacterium]|nr:hypothetical protein [Hyphomonadaceae bacterium]
MSEYACGLPIRILVAGVLSAGLALAPVSLAAPQATGGPSFGKETHATIEVVVKFKDDSKVQAIVDTFWTDPAKARAHFENFRRGRAELEGASLVRVTYSSELVLAFPAPLPRQSRESIRDLLARLKAASDIAYAELDRTVSIEGP